MFVTVIHSYYKVLWAQMNEKHMPKNDCLAWMNILFKLCDVCSVGLAYWLWLPFWQVSLKIMHKHS